MLAEAPGKVQREVMAPHGKLMRIHQGDCRCLRPCNGSNGFRIVHFPMTKESLFVYRAAILIKIESPF